MDRGAWWSIVHGVTKSLIQLSHSLSLSLVFECLFKISCIFFFNICGSIIALYSILVLFYSIPFCSIHLFLYLYTKSHCSDYYSFKVSLEIR